MVSSYNILHDGAKLAKVGGDRNWIGGCETPSNHLVFPLSHTVPALEGFGSAKEMIVPEKY